MKTLDRQVCIKKCQQAKVLNGQKLAGSYQSCTYLKQTLVTAICGQSRHAGWILSTISQHTATALFICVGDSVVRYYWLGCLRLRTFEFIRFSVNTAPSSTKSDVLHLLLKVPCSQKIKWDNTCTVNCKRYLLSWHCQVPWCCSNYTRKSSLLSQIVESNPKMKLWQQESAQRARSAFTQT